MRGARPSFTASFFPPKASAPRASARASSRTAPRAPTSSTTSRCATRSTAEGRRRRVRARRGCAACDCRRRWRAVAARLGYVPNLSARTLKQRTSRVVGVVVSELGNQFYAALAAGVEQTLREANYQMLLLGDNSDVAQELKGVRTFISMRAPGVIMTPVSNSAADLLVARGLPVVEADRRLATSSCD